MNFDNLRSLLDSEHEFPCEYTFKFIIPKTSLTDAREVFEGFKIKERQSSSGKYISLTLDKSVENSDEVIAIYQRAQNVPGLLAL